MRKNLYSHDSLSNIGLTQGSVITNCVAEGYSGSKVWGVIITPKCDLAHEGKVNTVHYLPMLNVEDWLNSIGKMELIEEWMKEVKNNIINAMKLWGINSDFVSMGVRYEDLLEICNAMESKPKKRAEFEKLCKAYFSHDDDLFKQFIQKSKNVSKYVKGMVGGNNHHYYLLEDWNNQNNLKVIILRDIRRINIDVARKFVKGFDYTEYREEFFKQNDLNYDSKEKSFDGFYYLEVQIQSPFIEHIIQSFSYNFNRVGVTDMESRSFDIFMDILKRTLA